MLAVEILSPSTRRFVQLLKRRYEAAGTASFWIVDLEPPTLTALTLSTDAYVEAATVTGSQPFTADWPFGVTVVPAELVSD